MGGEKNDKLHYRLKGKISLTNHAAKLPFDYQGTISLAAENQGKTGQ